MIALEIHCSDSSFSSRILETFGKKGPRFCRQCNGWVPNAGPDGDLPKQIVQLRHLAEQAGRDPKTISVTAFATPADHNVLDEQEAAGVERAVFFVPAGRADTVLPLFDRYSKLI